MKREVLREILDKIKASRIGIIGDFCLDAYWFVDESRSEISVETGKATVAVRSQKYSLGGAGNVASNLTAIGVKNVRALGVIGADPYGAKMISLMQEAGINTSGLLIQHGQWSTHVYTKPYIGEAEQSRIDFGNFNVLTEETSESLIEELKSEIEDLDLIIINQQVLSGIHTPHFRRLLVELIKEFSHKKFIVDSRHYPDVYNGAYRKMNEYEAARLCGVEKARTDVIPYEDVRQYAEILFKRYKRPVFITRGSRGSLAIDESGIVEMPGLMIISRIDTVGAGDSYLAGVAAALASGNGVEVAAELGTFVAAVTIQKLYQTGTASPEEIMGIAEDPDYIYRPELAEDIRRANYVEDTEIEIAGVLPSELMIRHAIFDHDGTISTLREGWEQIMSPMMIRAIMGEQYMLADESLYHKVKSHVDEFIDKTTGIQTLLQMKGLVGLVREFGLVPGDSMQDEFGYKQIYNDALLQMVHLRVEKFRKGELSVEDFTIKNAVSLLSKLHQAGVKLYLASGTDEEDVRKEAAILGYAHFFEGRIYGAVGDITKEAKKIVLDRILDNIGSQAKGEQIVTFGDGPVEMRETRKRGGIAVGLASNEIRRFGLNLSKRERLIKAGADIIIPDFGQSNRLLKLLGMHVGTEEKLVKIL
ncbi:MAG TPA: PfkB family carbohydrate kinase [Cyclobacteriaceae bacterium]|nr:PfkB family carbohydrate kinase [Cyclobacteriaceae bacterium]